MTLTERHVINKNNPLFKKLDELCFRSKNLYNATLYRIRQEYFSSKLYLGYFSIQKEFQKNKQFDYTHLPAKTSQQTMRMVDQNFKSFFRALKEYQKNPGKFKGRPKIPGYLDPIDGRFLVIYTYQGISKKILDDRGLIRLEKEEIYFKSRIKHKDLCQVRIVPKGNCIVVEVVYEVLDISLLPDNNRYAAIDLGIDNLATVCTNVPGETPLVYSGKSVKSWNYYYNKSVSYYKSILSTVNKGKRKGWSKRLERITFKRDMKIQDYFHKVSRGIVNYLVSRNINTLIVGNNQGWKQNTNLGKIGNQNFIQIPFLKLIKMLEYKCRLVGINFYVVTEEYTSKCSFLDQEGIQKHDQYLGKRIYRGLFRTSNGILINADVNGGYNILRKCKPNAFNGFRIRSNGIMGVVVHPIIKEII